MRHRSGPHRARRGAAKSALLASILAVSLPAAGEEAPEGDVPPCPPGSERRGAPPPEGESVWCEDAEGRRQGPYLKWRSGGALWVKGQYEDRRQEGWWRIWSEEGRLISEREYRGGRKVARRRHGDEATEVRRSRPSDPVHPCPEGSVVGGAVPPDGYRQWCEKRRDDGAWVRHGPWLRFASTRLPPTPSERKTYRDGVLHGPRIEYRDGRRHERVEYVEGRWHGTRTTWHESGAKASEAEYRNGERTGRETRWDEEGRLVSEARPIEEGGVRQTTYYPNGQRKRERSRSPDHSLHGPVREWWANGQLKLEGEREAHREVGTWREWNAEGDLLRVTTYHPDGHREDEAFVVYDHAPEGAPRPVDAGGIRAPEAPLRCPEDARVVREELSLGAGDGLRAFDDAREPEGVGEQLRDAVLTGLLNVIRLPLGQLEACARGWLWKTKEGPAVIRTPEGDRRADGFFRDGERHGRWQLWARDGSLAERIDFAEGRRHGPSIRWHDGGEHTRSVKRYAEGVLSGPSATWWPNGAYRTTGAYRRDERHGPWTQHDENGFRIEEGGFREGEKHGRWVRRHPEHGMRWQKTFRGGVLHGPFDDGEWRGRYRDGEKHELWVRTRGGEKLEEGFFRNGVRHGAWTFYYDGAPRARGRFERNRRVGPWVEYHPNGQKRAEGPYVWCEEPPEVQVTHLPPSGQRNYRRPAPKGCRVGTWTFWRSDGSRRGRTELDDRNAPPVAGFAPGVTTVAPDS